VARVLDVEEIKECVLRHDTYPFVIDPSTQKCDAAKPACGGCTKSGHVSECEYQRPPTRDVATEAPAYKIIRWGLAVNANKIAPEVPLVDHSLEWWKSDQVPPTITDFLWVLRAIFFKWLSR
jgi:hypothetical protein